MNRPNLHEFQEWAIDSLNCKQVIRILFFILGKLLFIISFALFSLPNNLFCVDYVRRIYMLINRLGLKGLQTEVPPPPPLLPLAADILYINFRFFALSVVIATMFLLKL